jgi:hypothetical protein
MARLVGDSFQKPASHGLISAYLFGSHVAGRALELAAIAR